MPCTPSSPQMPGPHCPSLGHSLLCCQAPGQGKDFPHGWAPLGLPCTVSGHVAPGAVVARTKLALTPSGARHLCASGYTARLEGRWLPGSHPGLRGCVPPGLAPSQGQLPSIWCPWPAPSAGQVLLSGPHKTPLLAFPRLPRGFPEALPPRAGPVPAPALPGNGSASRARPPPPLGALEDPAHTARVPLLSPALLGGLSHPAAEVLMVLCPALHYFPECQGHVLASGAGCGPAEPDAAAAAWGANGRSTPHVEFNYWLSSSTEYIG